MAILERAVNPAMSELLNPEEVLGEPTRFLWTKDQYPEMADLGWFNDLHVELIEGEIYRMAPIGSKHFTGIHLVNRASNRIFTTEYLVVVQSSFDADPRSEPEPDVAVYEGDDRAFTDAPPTATLLFVEASDKTLKYDQTRKASLYARAGVIDYRIVNVKKSQIEVYREPQPKAGEPYGYGYSSVTIIPADGTLSPLAKPGATVAAADLLPETVRQMKTVTPQDAENVYYPTIIVKDATRTANAQSVRL